MKKNISVLDCTLRDGGFALEDAEKNNIKTKVFDEEMIRFFIDKMIAANIDVIELGTVQDIEDDQRKHMSGFAIFSSIEELCSFIPTGSNSLYAAFLRGPDVDLGRIPEYREGLCNIIRLMVRYSELDKSLEYCKELSLKGYKVSVQPMITMRYTEEQLYKIIDAVNSMHAFALYFVDSYGYMTSEDVFRFYHLFHENLDQDIRIGFHAHNNMNLAFSNAISFIQQAGNRHVVVDSCAAGMGQGAGNLQTELLINYLNEIYKKDHYGVKHVLDMCELIFSFNTDFLWGYSPLKCIPAMNKTAYKYAPYLNDKYSYSDIYDILLDLPENLKQRFTENNALTILKMKGFI